jgi:hypothetical protein
VSDDGNVSNILHVRFLKSGAKVRREVACSTRTFIKGEGRRARDELRPSPFALRPSPFALRPSSFVL